MSCYSSTSMFASNYASIKQTRQEEYRYSIHSTVEPPTDFSWTVQEDIANKAALNVTVDQVVPEPVKQGVCGSCWAIAVCSAVFGRTNVSKSKLNIEPSIMYPSPEEILSCVRTRSTGCAGGDALEACIYIEQQGVSTSDSIRYRCPGTDCGTLDNIHSCGNIEKQNKVYIQLGSTRYVSQVLEMKQTIFLH